MPGLEPTNQAEPTDEPDPATEPAPAPREAVRRRRPSAAALALLPFLLVAGTVFVVTRTVLPGSNASAGIAAATGATGTAHHAGPVAAEPPASMQMGMERGGATGTAGTGAAPAESGTMTSLVPNLVGLPLEDAVRILKAEGMTIGVVLGKKAPALPGAIIGQEPEAGSHLGYHRIINITLSTGTVEANHASMGGGGVSCRISAEEPDEAYCLTTKLFKY